MENTEQTSTPTAVAITPEQLSAYLGAFEPQSIVGTQRESCDCVLFRYWQSQGLPVLWVDRWETVFDNVLDRFPHPLWLEMFVQLLDEEDDAVDLAGYLPEQDDDGEEENGNFIFLTAGMALGILAECT